MTAASANSPKALVEKKPGFEKKGGFDKKRSGGFDRDRGFGAKKNNY
jgi:hypothetical protein